MQIRPKIRFIFAWSIRWAKFRRLLVSDAGKSVWKVGCLISNWKHHKLIQSFWRVLWQFLLKLTMPISVLATLFLDIHYPNGILMSAHRTTYQGVHWALFITTKNWKPHNKSTSGAWRSKNGALCYGTLHTTQFKIRRQTYIIDSGQSPNHVFFQAPF